MMKKLTMTTNEWDLSKQTMHESHHLFILTSIAPLHTRLPSAHIIILFGFRKGSHTESADAEVHTCY
jgi:hypothetical protein